MDKSHGGWKMAKEKLNPHIITNRFRKLAKEANLNQQQIARRVGLTQASICRYLSGSLPSLRGFFKIAQSFNVSMDWLCGRTDKRK